MKYIVINTDLYRNCLQVFHHLKNVVNPYLVHPVLDGRVPQENLKIFNIKELEIL